jgi:hypothetical protein
MTHRIAVGASLAVALVVSAALAKETVKSGPQVGSSRIIPFNPLHATGPDEGKKLCLV